MKSSFPGADGYDGRKPEPQYENTDAQGNPFNMAQDATIEPKAAAGIWDEIWENIVDLSPAERIELLHMIRTNFCIDCGADIGGDEPHDPPCSEAN